MSPVVSAREEKTRTLQYREFGGMNVTDHRTALKDSEFRWLENIVRIGNGSLRVVPKQAAAIATLSQGIASLWGVLLTLSGTPTPVLIAIGQDGSVTQVKTDGTTTVLAGATTVTAKARVTMWQDDRVLVIDSTKGYFSWNGTTWTQESATVVGKDLAVFQGRVWILVSPRTIRWTAPNTFNDFATANGAGSMILRDEAFPGGITTLRSALEQLWIIGQGAVDVITNVSTSGGVTTFSITNLATGIGTPFPTSVTSFFRFFLFLTTYGVFALVGATPQKLSGPLDDLFPDLNLGTDAPAAVGTIYGEYAWMVLVTYQGTEPGVATGKVLLTFIEGVWFVLRQGDLTWITSLLVSGQPQVWGTDGTTIFRLVADATQAVAYRIRSKLWDFGDGTQRKELIRVGFDFFSRAVVSPGLQAENEVTSVTLQATSNTTTITFVGAGPITFVGAAAITWVASGLQLVRQSVNLLGRYLGLTLSGTEKPWTLTALHFEVRGGGRWN